MLPSVRLHRARLKLIASLLAYAVVASWPLIQATAHAQVLLLDSFDAPAPRRVIGAWGNGVQVFGYEDGLPVVGTREVILVIDKVPESISVLAVGGGSFAVAQGAGVFATSEIVYGTLIAPETEGEAPPELNLDLTPYDALRFTFIAVEDTLNINVIYSTPHAPPGTVTQVSTGLNTAPAEPNGALTFDVPFDNTQPFDWPHVHGIEIMINASGHESSISGSYTLDKLEFVKR
jgi:hypothetical protein